jgi:hypothetical protein
MHAIWWKWGVLASLAACVAACSFDSSGLGPDGSPVGDGMPGDASGPGNDLARLLLTEVALADDDHEFIEVYNPGTRAVELTRYYLADTAQYAFLPGAFGSGPRPVIDERFDFIVKFPDGATIGPGEVRVVATTHSGFADAYARAPDFAIVGAGSHDRAMVDPSGSFMGSELSLSNEGEGVVLFYWDGGSDLVTDVDMLPAGSAILGANALANKTGLAVDGPDGDSEFASYRADRYTIGEMDIDAENGLSYKRVTHEDGFEIHDGSGNGVLGDDETSEDVSRTWEQGTALTAPTPGELHPALLR